MKVPITVRIDEDLLDSLDGLRGDIPRNMFITRVLEAKVVRAGVPVPVSVPVAAPLPVTVQGVTTAADLCVTPEHKRRKVLGGTCPDCGLKMSR